jgi:DNA-binding transcriptional MerR regulator
MTDETMTIRAMCETFGVTPRTLRFYEQKELLAPRREGTRRLYTRRDRARLKLILRGKRFGVPLEEIRQLLDSYHREGAVVQAERSLAVAARRLAQLEAERAALDATIAELKDQMAWGAELVAAPRTAA